MRKGDRVATLSSNHQEHLETYLAVPSMGAVLHTLNPRLSPPQLAFVIDHAQDKVVIVDAAYLPALLRSRRASRASSTSSWWTPTEMLARRSRRQAGGEASCATRSSWTPRHQGSSGRTLTSARPRPCVTRAERRAIPRGSCTAIDSLSCTSSRSAPRRALLSPSTIVCFDRPDVSRERLGAPVRCLDVRVRLRAPGATPQRGGGCNIVARERPTFSAAVPTVWNDVLRYAEDRTIRFLSLRLVVCGGSAVPRTLMERFEQQWGSDRSGVGDDGDEPSRCDGVPASGNSCGGGDGVALGDGRLVPGVEARIVDDVGKPRPRDGRSIGEIEVRGPWITGRYHGDVSRIASTTDGCEPETSGPWTNMGSSRSRTDRRT